MTSPAEDGVEDHREEHEEQPESTGSRDGGIVSKAISAITGRGAGPEPSLEDVPDHDFGEGGGFETQEPGDEAPGDQEMHPPEDPVESGDSDQGFEELKHRINQLEQMFASDESEELGRISQLEERVEQLEYMHDGGVEQKLEELESRLESVQTPQLLDDRMTELEDVVMNPDKHIDKLLEHGLAERLEQEHESMDKLMEKVDDKVSVFEAELERISDSQQQINARLDEIRDTAVGKQRVDELDRKLETLWEALDEQVGELEDAIAGNEDDIEGLFSDLVDLTEMVKDAIDR